MTKAISICVAAALLFGLGWLASNHRAPKAIAVHAEGDFGTSIRDALRDASPAIRTQRLAKLFDTMRADQIEEAVAVSNREINFVAPFEIELLFEAWARHDPHAALAHAESWSAQTRREPAIEATIQSWATQDPAAAREVVTKILEEKPLLRRIALRGLVVGWVYSGQPGVASYVYELPEPYPTMGSVALVGAQTRRLDVDGLESWADDVLRELEDAKFEREFFRKIAKALARRDSGVARVWVDRHGDADYAVDGIRLVVENGLPGEPESIMDWSSHVGPEVQRPFIQFAAKKWMAEEFAAASSYIEGAELAPRHDPIVTEYVGALIRKSEWHRSIDWAQRITDEKIRNETLQRASMLWLRKDPTAAEVWLAESPLDEAARARVREAAARPIPKKPGSGRRQRPRAPQG